MNFKIFTGIHKFLGTEIIGIYNEETKQLEDCFGVVMVVDEQNQRREPMIVPLRPPIYLHDRFDNRIEYSFPLEDIILFKELESFNETIAAKLLSQYWMIHNIKTKKQAKETMNLSNNKKKDDIANG